MRRDYTIDELIAMTKEEMWSLPEGGLRVTFSDGVIKDRTNVFKINWYFWQLFKFGGLKGVSTAHFMGGEDFNFNGGIPSKELSKIFWEVFVRKCGGFFPGQGLDLVWDMSRRTYQIINELYNDSIFKMGEHVSTLSLVDLIQVLDDPEVIDAKAKWAAGEMDVDSAHNVTWGRLTSKDEQYKFNELARGCRTSIFNRRQTNQTIGPRANIPEINGEAHRTPIAPGYIEGLDKQYDRIIESCTASIAYFMAKAPLEASEYNNRMAQFMTSVIRGIDHTDCCSDKTIPWRVRDAKDLEILTGKFHMVDGKYQMIFGYEEHLIGELIQVRSFTTCKSKDPQYPCAICVGWNAWTTPPGSVLGHHLSIEPLSRISQTILSTKHVIASTKPLYLSIAPENQLRVRLDMENPHNVIFNREPKADKIFFRFARDEAIFLNDILNIEEIQDIIPTRISSLTNIQVLAHMPKKATPTVYNVDVSLGGFGSPLSKEFLTFLRHQFDNESSWDIVGTNIEVDVTEWDFGQPVVVTPKRGADIMSVLYTFQDFVNSPSKANAVRAADFDAPGPAIEALLYGLDKYIDVNFAHAEVFVRALMSGVDAAGYLTYELPRGGEPFKFGSMKDIIHNRSESTNLAFEGHVRHITSPGTYLKDDFNIPSASMDHIWCE
ncbi:RNA polymerase beta subunit [Vibrio phage vB_VpaM_sm033]|nr:RNA polymerase beta subunit [Vibrio phage vB_VpaM_sm033]